MLKEGVGMESIKYVVDMVVVMNYLVNVVVILDLMDLIVAELNVQNLKIKYVVEEDYV